MFRRGENDRVGRERRNGKDARNFSNRCKEEGSVLEKNIPTIASDSDSLRTGDYKTITLFLFFFFSNLARSLCSMLVVNEFDLRAFVSVVFSRHRASLEIEMSATRSRSTIDLRSFFSFFFFRRPCLFFITGTVSTCRVIHQGN